MQQEKPTQRFAVHRVAAKDGYQLGVRVYGDVDHAAGVVVMHGAMAVPQRFYRAYAEYLASRKLAVISYDYRGVGDSRPMALSGFHATARQWAELDARGVLAFARGLNPPLPLLSVGHSFGGQIAGIIDEARDVAGSVMVGVQLGYYRDFSPAMQARLLGSFGVLLPLVSGLWGYTPGRLGLSEDLPKGVAEEWAKWCLSPGYLRDHISGASERLAAFDRELLLYTFTDDEYAPKPTVQALTRALSSANLVHRRFEPFELGADSVGHFGFFKPSRRDLWQESADFFHSRLSGMPPSLRSHSPHGLGLEPEDIMRDLAYGRA